MEEKYQWNLKEIFENEDEYNKTKDSFYKILEEISKYEGSVCKSANNLYNVYKLS